MDVRLCPHRGFCPRPYSYLPQLPYFPHTPYPTQPALASAQLIDRVEGKAREVGDAALLKMLASAATAGGEEAEAGPSTGGGGGRAMAAGVLRSMLADYHTHDSMLKEDPTEVSVQGEGAVVYSSCSPSPVILLSLSPLQKVSSQVRRRATRAYQKSLDTAAAAAGGGQPLRSHHITRQLRRLQRNDANGAAADEEEGGAAAGGGEKGEGGGGGPGDPGVGGVGEEGEEDEALWDAAWEGPPAATQGGGGSFHTQGGSFLSQQQGGSFRAQGSSTAAPPGAGGGGPSASQRATAVPLVPPRTALSMPPAAVNGKPRTAAAAVPLVAPRTAPSVPPTNNGAAAVGGGAADGNSSAGVTSGAGGGGGAAGAGSAMGDAPAYWEQLMVAAKRALLSDLHFGRFRAMAMRVGDGWGRGGLVPFRTRGLLWLGHPPIRQGGFP